MSTSHIEMTAQNDSSGAVSKYLPFERSFDAESFKKWSDEIKSMSLWCSAIYIVVIFVGRYAMRHRVPYDMRLPLICWNFVLAVFSIIGFIRTSPELVNGILLHGWSYTVCDASFYYGPVTGFWAWAFTASKVCELGDTAFIVLRKQSLILLHWYHHISVMIYCFYSYPQHISSGRWYMVMNYFIHSLMYTYFMLRALRVRMPRAVRVSVTSLQILQMVTGLIVVLSVYLLKTSGMECHQSYTNIAATFLMYVSYLILFVQFFYSEYAAPGKKPTSAVDSRNKSIQSLAGGDSKKLQ